MPKRTQAPAVPDFRLEKVECLVTGRKAQPMPIPQIQECGKTCVPINSTDNWLPKVISGHCRGDGSMVVKEFVDEVELLLATASLADEGGETRGRPLAAAAGAGESSPTRKGRSAFGLDDDSDEAELALVPSEPPKKARKIVVKELRTISCRGMELTVKVRDKGWGIAVPLEGPTLLMILKHLHERASADEKPEPDFAKKARRQEARSNRTDEDRGRLRWLSSVPAYEINWYDEKGHQHRCIKGLKVPRHDAFGKAYTHVQFETRRLQVLKKARQSWDDRDKTTIPLYSSLTLTR